MAKTKREIGEKFWHEKNGVEITYDVYSGQNDQSTLKQITDQAIADGVDAIIPIATLAAQVEETTQNISITGALEEILRTSGVGVRAFEKVFEIIDNIYDVLTTGNSYYVITNAMPNITKIVIDVIDSDDFSNLEIKIKYIAILIL